MDTNFNFVWKRELSKSNVVIIMGSKSDSEKVTGVCEMLNTLTIPFAVKIRSAHRTPVELVDLVKEIDATDSCKVIIAVAGMSAVLAGSIAAHTLKPVIALPLSSKLEINNQAALTAVTQLPPGSGVLAVGLDCTINAALEAAKIVALSDPETLKALQEYKNSKRTRVLEEDRKIDD